MPETHNDRGQGEADSAGGPVPIGDAAPPGPNDELEIRRLRDQLDRIRADVAAGDGDVYWYERYEVMVREATDWKRWCEEREAELAEARAATPEVLWRGETSELTTRSRTHSLAVYPPVVEVPPRTRVAVISLDSATEPENFELLIHLEASEHGEAVWWAESPQFEGWTVAASTLSELRDRAHESLRDSDRWPPGEIVERLVDPGRFVIQSLTAESATEEGDSDGDEPPTETPTANACEGNTHAWTWESTHGETHLTCHCGAVEAVVRSSEFGWYLVLVDGSPVMGSSNRLGEGTDLTVKAPVFQGAP